MKIPWLTLGAAALALSAHAGAADAFCGFYVSGSGEKMFNDATEVVLMRDGTRTVLSMQNDYKGPLEDFAMVIPVPVVLHEADVKTLPRTVFDHTDALGSPRLVEYWEQDPCPVPRREMDDMDRAMAAPSASFGAGMANEKAKKETVHIEAKFDVAEYKILILSATDSTGLETWLTQNHYKIPPGAEPLLRPYVEGGSKFFVAKVDPQKVAMHDGHAALSPIRFHYDSEDFTLPIRLGMANSSGKQDLIVNIISPDKRFEVANYRNVFIPTNFDVKPAVKTRFAEFYAALFDKTVEATPGAVVTEYAWTAVPNYHCDPCTDADISNPDLMTLGGDIVGGQIAQGNFVLTRLHARYGKGDMKDDLRFRVAKPVTGGREQWSKAGLEYGAVSSPQNYFQARYAIRHAWTGPMACAHPVRGVWGGPPDGNYQPTIAASKLAFAPRGQLQLAGVIKRDLWEIGVRKESSAGAAPAPPGGGKFATPPIRRIQGFGFGALLGLVLIAGGVLLRRRRTGR
ncbi:MAG TPA: DUF2330 domain-containing protein [Kofleriaceae bacterium]|jgi:hypothetical protein|nr:DUF2330 domain-containing protein [Kofleriaceae bacterium]